MASSNWGTGQEHSADKSAKHQPMAVSVDFYSISTKIRKKNNTITYLLHPTEKRKQMRNPMTIACMKNPMTIALLRNAPSLSLLL